MISIRKLLYASILVIGFPAALSAEECDDPGYTALKTSLAAQIKSKVEELKRTSDCSMVPNIMAIYQDAERQLHAALARIPDRCKKAASLQYSAIEARLRAHCRTPSPERNQERAGSQSGSNCSTITDSNHPSSAACRQREAKVREADATVRKGAEHENNKDYDAAKRAYAEAILKYATEEVDKAYRAERSLKRVECNGSLHEYDQLEARNASKSAMLQQLRDADGKCGEYPGAVAHIAKKRVELQQTGVPAVRSTPDRERGVSRSVLPNLNVAKPSSGVCPSGYTIARNMRDQCVVRGAAECYAGPISCSLDGSSGCCFNTHRPPVDSVNGHFCCPRGTQCVFDEGPTRGTCQ